MTDNTIYQLARHQLGWRGWHMTFDEWKAYRAELRAKKEAARKGQAMTKLNAAQTAVVT